MDPYARIDTIAVQLIEAHDRLREQLSDLRTGVARPDLRTHCLAFCSAVSVHHGAEDAGLFPALAERFPELRPVLDELRRDHELVAELLRRLSDGVDPSELDGLAAILESHLSYEERALASYLGSMVPPRDAAWI